MGRRSSPNQGTLADIIERTKGRFNPIEFAGLLDPHKKRDVSQASQPRANKEVIHAARVYGSRVAKQPRYFPLWRVREVADYMRVDPKAWLLTVLRERIRDELRWEWKKLQENPYTNNLLDTMRRFYSWDISDTSEQEFDRLVADIIASLALNSEDDKGLVKPEEFSKAESVQRQLESSRAQLLHLDDNTLFRLAQMPNDFSLPIRSMLIQYATHFALPDPPKDEDKSGQDQKNDLPASYVQCIDTVSTVYFLSPHLIAHTEPYESAIKTMVQGGVALKVLCPPNDKHWDWFNNQFTQEIVNGQIHIEKAKNQELFKDYRGFEIRIPRSELQADPIGFWWTFNPVKETWGTIEMNRGGVNPVMSTDVAIKLRNKFKGAFESSSA